MTDDSLHDVSAKNRTQIGSALCLTNITRRFPHFLILSYCRSQVKTSVRILCFANCQANCTSLQVSMLSLLVLVAHYINKDPFRPPRQTILGALRILSCNHASTQRHTLFAGSHESVCHRPVTQPRALLPRQDGKDGQAQFGR